MPLMVVSALDLCFALLYCEFDSFFMMSYAGASVARQGGDCHNRWRAYRLPLALATCSLR